jgi:hypothetical protein
MGGHGSVAVQLLSIHHHLDPGVGGGEARKKNAVNSLTDGEHKEEHDEKQQVR